MKKECWYCFVLNLDGHLEAASISDHMTLDYVCGLKILILGVSYPSAASTHRGQVVLGMRPPTILYNRPERACLRRSASRGRFKSCSILFT